MLATASTTAWADALIVRAVPGHLETRNQKAGETTARLWLGRLLGGAPKGGAGEASPRSGAGPIFRLYTEVKSTRVAAPDPRRFEVPAGYTKK